MDGVKLLSNQILIRKKTPPTRCEICHLSDQFDPNTETCHRCSGIVLPATVSNSYTPQVAQGATNISSVQKIFAKILIYTFLTMLGSLSLTILSGVFQVFPLAVIFGLLSFFSGLVFALSLGVFTLYMVGTVLASALQSIYYSLRARL